MADGLWKHIQRVNSHGAGKASGDRRAEHFVPRTISSSLESGEYRRNLDGDRGAATGIADHVETGLSAVKDFEALLNVLHADAGAGAAEG